MLVDACLLDLGLLRVPLGALIGGRSETLRDLEIEQSVVEMADIRLAFTMVVH